MAALVAVISRHFIDTGLGGPMYVADVLMCGHEIWYAITDGYTYPTTARRRCPTCEDPGLLQSGQPPIRRNAPR